MKKQILILFVFLSIGQYLIAQELSPAGGGAYTPLNNKPCLLDEERASIQRQLAKSQKELKKRGLLKASSRRLVLFDFPLRAKSSLGFNNFYDIGNFVDHNPSYSGSQYGASNLDYYCDNRTYDTNDGYNHQGTDYGNWPFPWYLYENNQVEVIAAASGTIIGKDDGQDDDHCTCSGSWNAVYIQQSDGSVTWYGHLKRNSLTTKSVGQNVSKGEYLGIVGSSGCSTGPHLHFEIYDASDNLIDPYAGSCNSLNGNTSWWASQPAYREPTLNALLTHDDAPNHGCRTEETPNISNYFIAGQTVYFGTYYKDQLQGDVSNLRIRRPDNSIYASWNHTSPQTYNASWWYWYYTLPTQGPFGTWKFEVDFHGQTYMHTFQYVDPNSCPNDVTISSNPSNNEIVRAANTISTSGPVSITANYNVTFQAGTSITLNTDFHAQAGSNFLATIDNCNAALNPFNENSTNTSKTNNIKSNLLTEIPLNIEVYPNPFTNGTNIAYQLAKKTNITILLIDYNGKKVKQIIPNVEHSAGIYTTSLSSGNLSSGIYYVQLITNEEVLTKKVVLLK